MDNPLPRKLPNDAKKKSSSIDAGSQTPDEVDFREHALSHVLDGFPYSRMDRIFIKFENVRPRGYDGMEVGNGFDPVTFVKKVNLATVNRRYEALKKTYHQNLVNLTGISITDDAAYLVYERTGLSLTEIKKYGRITFDRVAVATICREVFRYDLALPSKRLTSGQIIHGLIYIHDVLRISHGELNCDNVFVNEDGEVQIGTLQLPLM
jgi:serine/threonine protein kinase